MRESKIHKKKSLETLMFLEALKPATRKLRRIVSVLVRTFGEKNTFKPSMSSRSGIPKATNNVEMLFFVIHDLKLKAQL